MPQLPIASVVEEYNVAKVPYQLMLSDSPASVIQEAAPELKTGTKWTPNEAIAEAESSLFCLRRSVVQPNIAEQGWDKPILTCSLVQVEPTRW